MSKTKLNVLLKKMQKDDKKEGLEFHVQGNELPNTQELIGSAGSIVIINVEESKLECSIPSLYLFRRIQRKLPLSLILKAIQMTK
ncbi:hypothetical protein [Peribacillus muralis]|uniref:hypothetical protein n=1 Tax=Peribacillus muralis TaxID=264697 RepID=UPI003D00C5BE